jgi:hypothetical protein
MLRARRTASELMDDARQGEAAIRAGLADIERLNRWSRAYAPTLAGWMSWAVAWLGCGSRDPMVVHEPTVSVARDFSWDDRLRLAREADVPVQIRWIFPFRWLVSGESCRNRDSRLPAIVV